MSQADSLYTHAITAGVLESYVDELERKNSSLYHAYTIATSNEQQSAKRDTGESYMSFVIENSIKGVHEEQQGGSRSKLGKGEKVADKARPAILKALRIGQVLLWLEKSFGVGVSALLACGEWERL